MRVVACETRLIVLWPGGDDRSVNELKVSYAGANVVVSPEERLGFGRSGRSGDGRVGWGYTGRFLEIDPGSQVHRLWGEIVFLNGGWCVRSLGSVEPIAVLVPGIPPVRLACWDRTGAADIEPAEFVVTKPRFAVRLAIGSKSWTIECQTATTSTTPGVSNSTSTGDPTTLLGDDIVEATTKVEFEVLWAMAREFRERAPSPRALSYTRIRRDAGLDTERQATAAVERVVRRFRAAALLPEALPPEQQRDRICEIAVSHRILERLSIRYGEPTLR